MPKFSLDLCPFDIACCKNLLVFQLLTAESTRAAATVFKYDCEVFTTLHYVNSAHQLCEALEPVGLRAVADDT